MNNYQTGHFSEFLALMFLRCKGYRKVSTNVDGGNGTGAGEIDLIVRKGRMLVFVEVKKRAAIEDAVYAILPNQQQRIRRAAEAFLAKHPQYADFDVRFDAVFVELPFRFRHIQNAF